MPSSFDPSVITYMPEEIGHGTASLAAASAALLEAQTDLVNINALLAEHMGGAFHNSHQEQMLHQIEQPLQHLGETVGVHGNVLDSITSDAVMLDASLAGGG